MAHGGDVIEELKADHREVAELFGKIEELPTGDPKRKEFADLVTIELVRHAVAEEAHLYPAVREHLSNGDAVADRELADHTAAERTMKELERRGADDPEFDRLITQLMAEVRHHVRDEESNLFPQLAKAASASVLNDLGDKVRRAKKLAPTRPHPAAPTKPPANRILAPGLGLVDRMRDALSGRGKES
ncbi:hemerythrin domain-containing protein [Streptomyces sp. MB09-02B]|uniref:hemerythrin domain-containing protein n=1 Tax=Streptomyces sp. MB09-02B TaxID=3028667 RepID=UPI0029A54796|nr:hemerythrin domain-containing protein [Streptomyces sp. MB09-02B]MDX3644712.1 hemerythrin domain-containing protein [Streptomyces sp. MB09-02B]